MSRNGAREPSDISDVLTTDENVDVLTYLTLLRRNAIPHAGMKLPQYAERIGKCGGFLLNPDPVAAAREFTQGARDVKGQRHDYFPFRRAAAALEGLGFARAARVVATGFELEAAEPSWMTA